MTLSESRQSSVRSSVSRFRLLSRSPRFWFVCFLLIEAVVVRAFLSLLRLRFSPKNYMSTDASLGTTEFAWLGVALVCAVAAAVLLWGRSEFCRAAVCGSVPLCVIALVVARNGMTGRGNSYVELLFFGTACGWAVPLGVRAWRRGFQAHGGDCCGAALHPTKAAQRTMQHYAVALVHPQFLKIANKHVTGDFFHKPGFPTYIYSTTPLGLIYN